MVYPGRVLSDAKLSLTLSVVDGGLVDAVREEEEEGVDVAVFTPRGQ